jgi:hypothetical protein
MPTASDVTDDIRDENHRQGTADETDRFLRDVTASYASEDSDKELEVAGSFRCICRLNSGDPCYTFFQPEEMVRRRLLMQELASGELVSTIHKCAMVAITVKLESTETLMV